MNPIFYLLRPTNHDDQKKVKKSFFFIFSIKITKKNNNFFLVFFCEINGGDIFIITQMETQENHGYHFLFQLFFSPIIVSIFDKKNVEEKLEKKNTRQIIFYALDR